MHRILDIETGPAPESVLQEFEPEFSAPANYKDPEKIEAAISKQREEWRNRAALSPITGRVLAIGFGGADLGETIFEGGSEADLLNAAWPLILDETCRIIGFCSNRFDIPFLLKRSWALGIPVPLDELFRGRYLRDRFVDLADVWQCGSRDEHISLDRLARLLGCGGKTGSGADFARLLASDREAALEYLRQDLRLTEAVAARLGVIPGHDGTLLPLDPAAVCDF